MDWGEGQTLPCSKLLRSDGRGQSVQIGFIGVGLMGNPMARRLIQAGHQLTVHDLRREAAANLLELGARWADSPREVAKASEVVFTSLPGPAEVTKVVLDPDAGLLAGLTAGSGYIDTTTNAPLPFRRLAEACRAHGVEVLDAPVSGGSSAAENGTLTFMVGGDAAVFTKFRPLLERLGQNIFYVGETGAGCTAKLVTQYMGYCNWVASVEGLLIAAKAGIDLGTLVQIVPVSAGGSRTFDVFVRVLANRDFNTATTGLGTLDIVAKDMTLACELARDVRALARMGNIAEDVLKRAQALGWGQQAFPIAMQVLEEWAGVELRTATPLDAG